MRWVPIGAVCVVAFGFGACGGEATPVDGAVEAGTDAAADGHVGTDGGPGDASPDAPASDGPSTDTPVPGDLGSDGGSGTDAGCDADGDGHDAASCGGDDCDDADPARHPGATEVCDAAGHDEDCDPSTLGPDGDGDGYPSNACCNTQPSGALLCGTDCDDMRATVNPSALETCNGADDNCNGMIDEGVIPTWYIDADGDGYGAVGTTMTMMTCTRPAGYSATADDCNDAAAAAHPGGTEICDGLDNDCDGTTDPGCACTIGMTRMCGAMTSSGGFFTLGPCHPGMQSCAGGVWGPCSGNVDPMPELCSTPIDDNCDGTVNESTAMDARDWYPDGDADGYGDGTAAPVRACVAPGTRVLDATDCNDADPMVHPGATEVCNGRDDNCNGATDESALACPPEVNVASATCRASMCAVGTCSPGRGDCNSVYSDGCEVDTTTSGAHCGTCATVCNFACSASTCDDPTAVTAGGAHACGLRTSHQVACWGRGGEGQLGDATSRPYDSPMPIPSVYLMDATALAAGAYHTCALRTGGAMACWGQNLDGQLGTGDAPTSWNAPRALTSPTLGTVTSIGVSPNGNVSCAIATGGQAKCWGRNIAFQVGDGTFNTAAPGTRYTRAAPVNVSGLTNALAIAPGAYHTCAIRGSALPGQVVCWGANDAGELGDGVTMHSAGSPATREGCTEPLAPYLTSPLLPGDAAAGITTRADCHVAPVNVSGLTDAIAIASGDTHSCAIRTGGQVVCWGANDLSELGPGTASVYSTTPVAVTGLTNAITIAASAATTCVIRTGGQVSCWGDDTSGQLGNGTTGTPSASPVNVTGLTNAVGIAGGGSHFCALRSTGQLVCWGLGFDGQLGNGGVADHNTPVSVLSLP